MRLTQQQISEILPNATVLDGNTTEQGETVKFSEIKAAGGSHEEAIRNLVDEVRKYTDQGKTVYTNGGHVIEHDGGQKVAILSVSIEGESVESLQQRQNEEQEAKEPRTDEEREEADKVYATTEHHHGSREEAEEAQEEAFAEANEKSGANRNAAHGDPEKREEQKENLKDGRTTDNQVDEQRSQSQSQAQQDQRNDKSDAGGKDKSKKHK